MGKTAVRFLVLAQVAFFGLTTLCFWVLPESLTVSDGLSYFGVHAETIVPFTAAVVLAGFCMLRAAAAMPKRPPFSRVRVALFWIAVLSPGVLLTPYTMGMVMDAVHRLFGMSVFFIELWLTGWLVWRFGRNKVNLTFLAVQFGAGLVALVSLFDILMLEIHAQVVFQLAFGVLMVRLVDGLLGRGSAAKGGLARL